MNKKTTQSGGASNLSGAVYQMLWCLLRLMRIKINGTPSPDELQTILALEPKGGGGDLRIFGEITQVEQLKAKSDGETWSLQTIIASVLPDLFLATSTSTSNWEFRFVTEGRMGRWDDVYQFFRRLRGREIPTDILDFLDNSRELRFQTACPTNRNPAKPPFFSAATYTERSLFLRIAKHLQSCPAIKKQNLSNSELHRRLWQLLSAFHFDGEQTQERVVKEIDQLLLAVVDQSDNLPQVRNALAQELLTLASTGNVEITAEDLLSTVGLKATSLTSWSKIRSRSRRELENLLAHRRYDANFDVRATQLHHIAEDWCKSPRVLVFSGESGQGKTWAAAACALQATKEDAPVIWVDATGNTSEDLDRAADRFWLDIRGGEAPIPLRQIARRLGEVVPSSSSLKLRICFDGISDYTEASSLMREDWPSKGVSIAISCSSPIAESLAEAFRDKVNVIPCGDFSWEELHDLLNRKLGQGWTAIPDDVRAVLKRPLLASIYCDELFDERWHPTNEYEFFAATWKRLSTRMQVGTPLDAALVEKSVGGILLGQSYPWTLSQLLEQGVSDAALNRLEACGWLSRRADERFEISHDRLLNWGVAQSLYSTLRSKSRAVEDVVMQVAEINRTEARPGTPYLGYVPMDFFWLVAGDAELTESVGLRLLNALEPTYHRHTQELYEGLIPTLGERVASIVFKRYCEFDGAIWNLSAIGSAVVATAGTHLSEFVQVLIGDDSPRKQRRGIQLLGQKGCPELLDHIWAFHVQGLANPAIYLGIEENDWVLRAESWKALRKSAILRPQWIVEQIRKADPTQEPVHDLGWLIANLNDGKACWDASRDLLFQKVSPERPRVLAKLAGLYRDEQCVPWLQDSLSIRKDFCSPVAIQALSRIDKELAIAELPKVDLKYMTMATTWAFGEVWHRMPEKANVKLIEMAHANDPFKVAYVYRKRAHLIPIEIFQLLLDNLEMKLKALQAESRDQSQSKLYCEMSLLAECLSVDQLKFLESKRGSTLENELRKYLEDIGAFRNSHERNLALALLRRMGGSSFAEVVNVLLECGDRYGKLDALKWAVRSPNTHTFEIALRLTIDEDLWDRFPVVQNEAMKLLSTHEHWEGVALGIKKWGLNTQSDTIGERLVPEGYSAPWVESLRSEVVQNPLPGNVLALAFVGFDSDIPRLHEFLESSDFDSELAHACIVGLKLLGDKSERGVNLVSAHLRQKKHRRSAIQMLTEAGTPAGWKALWIDLQESFDYITALNLLNLSDHAEEVLALVKKQLPNQSQFGDWDLLHILVRKLKPEFRERLLADSWLRDRFHHQATAREGNFWVTGTKSRAIECLSEFNNDAAFTAAKQALETPEWHDRERFPCLLIEIDANPAIPLLLDRLVIEKSEPVRHAIGRALSPHKLQLLLASRFNSQDVHTRAAACFAASWADDGQNCVGKLRSCLDDLDEKVIDAAREALDRLAVRKECQRLSHQISEAKDVIESWRYIDAIVELISPGDEFQPWPKELIEACEALPWPAPKYVDERLKRRRKKVSDALRRDSPKDD